MNTSEIAANSRTFHRHLPDHLRGLVEQLASDVWRERKQATFDLAAQIEALGDQRELIETCMNALMDEVIAPATIGSRAAAQEVIAQVGVPFAGVIVHRVRTEPASAARMLVDVLAQIGTAADVPPLVEILHDQDRDENLRASVATVLGAIGGERAEAALVRALDSASPAVRLFSLDALRTTDVALAAEDLAPHFAEPSLRKAVAALLGRVPSKLGIELLASCLADQIRSLRATAVVALGEVLARPNCAPELSAYLEAQIHADPQRLAGLHSLLEHVDPQVCAAAVTIAATIGDQAVLPALLPRMDEQAVYERALGLIERLGSSAVRALTEMLHHEHDPSRLEPALRLAAAVEERWADPTFVAAIEQALDSLHDEVSIAACDALASVGDARTVPHLFRLFEREGTVAEHAADALGTVVLRVFGDRTLQNIEPYLTTVTTSQGLHHVGSDPTQAARLICRLLGRIGDPHGSTVLESLLQSPEAQVRVAAVQALGQIRGQDEGIVPLALALTDEHVQVRAMACRSLGRRGARDGIEGLRSAVADPDTTVRAAALQALTTIAADENADIFREVIVAAEPQAVLIPALAGLGKVGDDADLPLILNLCAANDAETVKAAARALVLQKGHRATAVLLGLIGHDLWDVRWVAAQGLLERADPTAREPILRAIAREDDLSVREALVRAIERIDGREEGAA